MPGIAAELGMKVTVGAWIDKDGNRNNREIEAAINLARRNSNVIGIVVGNETIYRGEQIPLENLGPLPDIGIEPAETARILREESQRLRGCESTARGQEGRSGEMGDCGKQRLPAHQGHPAGQEVGQCSGNNGRNLEHLARPFGTRLQRRFHRRTRSSLLGKLRLESGGGPGRRPLPASAQPVSRQAHHDRGIRLAERGLQSGNADPGPFQQASVLRNFVVRAEAIGMEYNIVEAIDQPWKYFEGGVGPYWGMLNAAREPKFSWTGPIANPDYWKLATIALLVGILMSLPILRLAEPTVMQALLLSAAANGVGAWAATVFAYWDGHYFMFGSAFALTLGVILLVPLVLIAMARIEEIAAVAFGHAPRRLIVKGATLAPATIGENITFPKVSIHIPAYYEPVDMLKQTLDAVSRLDYPNFECVVIINNTPDPVFWQPIQDHCRMLGERFKFINAEKVKGFKAGALRIAMERTAADAEIIGILDADYMVDPDWLKDLVPVFADPRVGIVQAPQEHRDEDRSLMHYMMNGEYAGFFDIGMVQRNEANAIIVHGTMCLMRRAAMDMVGGWSSRHHLRRHRPRPCHHRAWPHAASGTSCRAR